MFATFIYGFPGRSSKWTLESNAILKYLNARYDCQFRDVSSKSQKCNLDDNAADMQTAPGITVSLIREVANYYYQEKCVSYSPIASCLCSNLCTDMKWFIFCLKLLVSTANLWTQIDKSYFLNDVIGLGRKRYERGGKGIKASKAPYKGLKELTR